jgi:hypothetical protein
VVTKGAKAITDEDPGPESKTERTGNETGAGLQEGQIEIETKSVTEIAREIL